MTAEFGTVPCTVTTSESADLLIKWKEITHTLVDRGHAAELYQELTDQIGNTRILGKLSLGPASQNSRLNAIDELQSVTERSARDKSNNESTNKDNDGFTSCLDESDIDVDSYDEMDVPSQLIDEAADLSGYKDSRKSLIFEANFAQEEDLPADDFSVHFQRLSSTSPHYYAVSKGREVGIFISYGNGAQPQVHEYSGACHKAYSTQAACVRAAKISQKEWESRTVQAEILDLMNVLHH